MNSVKKIGVVTATRAEYGLFIPLLQSLMDDTDFELQLYVTGTHLSHEFGYTKDVIIADGFPICEEVDCIVGNDTAPALGKTSGLALMGLTEVFHRRRPDLIVLLGDRYETLCAAVAASLCRIPVAHLHGGEITEGAYDEGFRHAITKLSHLHFTSSREARQRVMQMGEAADAVYDVGAIGLDNITNMVPMEKNALQDSLGFILKERILLVTLHAETLEPGATSHYADILIDALGNFKECTIVITGTNADSEGRAINEKMQRFASLEDNVHFIQSLGQLRYISMLRYASMVIGNSSSGIIEVPSFGISTVNIGDRQKGRMRAASVIDLPFETKIIAATIRNLLNAKGSNGIMENPYGDGKTAGRIIRILKKTTLSSDLLHKSFIDKE